MDSFSLVFGSLFLSIIFFIIANLLKKNEDKFDEEYKQIANLPYDEKKLATIKLREKYPLTTGTIIFRWFGGISSVVFIISLITADY